MRQELEKEVARQSRAGEGGRVVEEKQAWRVGGSGSWEEGIESGWGQSDGVQDEEEEGEGVAGAGRSAGRYRTKADLQNERAQLLQEVLAEFVAAEDRNETIMEEVARWEREYVELTGAARRAVGRFSLNLTDKHWNLMAPPVRR